MDSQRDRKRHGRVDKLEKSGFSKSLSTLKSIVGSTPTTTTGGNNMNGFWGTVAAIVVAAVIIAIIF